MATCKIQTKSQCIVDAQNLVRKHVLHSGAAWSEPAICPWLRPGAVLCREASRVSWTGTGTIMQKKIACWPGCASSTVNLVVRACICVAFMASLDPLVDVRVPTQPASCMARCCSCTQNRCERPRMCQPRKTAELRVSCRRAGALVRFFRSVA